MGSKIASELLNSDCITDGLRVDSTTEYCTQWLAAVSAAQHDETGHLSQNHPFSESRPAEPISDHIRSSPEARASPRVTHHFAEGLALLPATPSPAPSHIDPTPEPESECFARIPHDDVERVHPYEISKYEKKPRRKTRPDRYDTNRQRQSGRQATCLSRRERREQKREKLRSRREVMNNFYSSATEDRHVLMKPTLATGAFVNGRGSVPTPLADLTFNELTFPIIRKSAPARAVSPQRPNGSRKAPSMQDEPELGGQRSKEINAARGYCPHTPSPQRPGHEVATARMQRPNNVLGAGPANEESASKLAISCPEKEYVDSGVDPICHDKVTAVEDAREDLHAQLDTAHLHGIEQALFYPQGHSDPRLPLTHTPQRNEAPYMENGTFLREYQGWAEYSRPEYSSQYMDKVPTYASHLDENLSPVAYDDYTLSSYKGCRAEIINVDYLSPSPTSEMTLAHKPDEETKAFWRPNFLR